VVELARRDPAAPYTGGASTFYRFVATLRAEAEAGAAPVIRYEMHLCPPADRAHPAVVLHHNLVRATAPPGVRGGGSEPSFAAGQTRLSDWRPCARPQDCAIDE